MDERRQMGSECLMYGVDLESRCLVNVPAEEERTVFLVGTRSLNTENQICRLEVKEDWLRVSGTVFVHPTGEVNHISSCPIKANVIATCSSNYKGVQPEHSLVVWNMDDDKKQLESMAQIQREGRHGFAGCEWMVDGEKAVVLSESRLELVDIGSQLRSVSCVAVPGVCRSLRLSPHNDGAIIAVAHASSVLTFDLRTKAEGTRIENAHSETLDADFNPNMPYMLASCGDDALIKIWDLRKPTDPVLSTRVRFNPVHDQLLLSCGSDAKVVLNCVVSTSSERDTTADEDGVHEALSDGPLDCVEEHEESVYSCEWAANDPWIYASLSLDGRAVVSRVKRQHKYSILQL